MKHEENKHDPTDEDCIVDISDDENDDQIFGKNKNLSLTLA
jgi:hypothetical protein